MYELKYRCLKDFEETNIEWLDTVPKSWELDKAKHSFYQSSTKGNKTLRLLSATQNRGVIPKDEVLGAVQVKESADLNGFKSVHPGDFVISLRSFQGGFEMSNYEGVITPAYTVFRNRNEIQHGYFKRLFKQDSFISVLNSMTVGIRDGKNIQYKDFSEMFLPFPPFAEQEKIANFLDIKTARFESIISKKEQLIDKLEEAKKSLVSEVVTGKVKIVDDQLVKRAIFEMKDSGAEWLGMIPFDWEYKSIKYIISIMQTGSTPSTSIPKFFDGNINWFNPKDLDRKILTEANKKITDIAIKSSQAKIFPGDSTLIIGIGATAGRVGYLTCDSSFNQQITGLYSKMNDNKFLYYMFGKYSDEFLKLANYTTLPILNNSFFKEFKMGLPLLDEQKRITKFLDKKTAQYDSIILKNKALIKNLKEAKKALVSEAVTGKIDLRDWEIVEEGEKQ